MHEGIVEFVVGELERIRARCERCGHLGVKLRKQTRGIFLQVPFDLCVIRKHIVKWDVVFDNRHRSNRFLLEQRPFAQVLHNATNCADSIGLQVFVRDLRAKGIRESWIREVSSLTERCGGREGRSRLGRTS